MSPFHPLQTPASYVTLSFMNNLVILLALLLASCSRPEASRTDALMNRLEQRVQLPQGARALAAYARYYAFGKSGEVEAIYLIPWSEEVRPGESCEELTANFTSKAAPCPNLKRRAGRLKPGERRWVANNSQFPIVLDGGCSVVSLLFDGRTAKMKNAKCNGDA